MEQHPIPQDITGFKFKLVGDMTLKQFGELAFGAVVAYVFYVSNWVPFIKWPLVAFFGLLGIALAFLPIEERPLDIWIINFVRAIYRPTLFVWKKDSGVIDYNTTVPTSAPANQTPPGVPINEDTQPQLSPWPYQKPGEEKGSISENKNTSGPKSEEKGSPTLTVTETEEEKLSKPTAEENKEPVIKEQVFVGEMPPTITKVEPSAAPRPIVVPQPNNIPQGQSGPFSIPVAAPVAPQPSDGVAKEEKQAIGSQASQSVTPSTSPLSVDGLERQRDEKLKELEAAKKQAEAAVAEQNIAADKAGVTIEGAVGPFANTKILTVDELAKLREQKVVSDDQARNKQISEGEQQLGKLLEQSRQLASQITELQNKLTGTTGTEDTSGVQGQIEALTQQKTALDGEVTKLQEEVSATRVEPLTRPAYQQPTRNLGGGVKIVPKPIEQPAPTVSLTDLPNVVNGIIITEAGMPLDGVIIVIKNKAGNSIRALKTNKAGQFMVSTPMETGVYYLEMERGGYTFDTLEVTLGGTVLKPLEITARKV